LISQWQTADVVNYARGTPFELFERMGNVFSQLETYVSIPMPDEMMMDGIILVQTEVLRVLAIATKEIKQNRASEFTFETRLTRLVHLQQKRF
jgi:hypothetical protein